MDQNCLTSGSEQREHYGFEPSRKKWDATKLLDYTGLVDQQIDLLATIDELELSNPQASVGASRDRTTRLASSGPRDIISLEAGISMAVLNFSGTEANVVPDANGENIQSQESIDAANDRLGSLEDHISPGSNTTQNQILYVDNDETIQANDEQHSHKPYHTGQKAVWKKFLPGFLIMAFAQIYLAVVLGGFFGGSGGEIFSILGYMILFFYIYGSVARVFIGATYSRVQRERGNPVA